MQHKELKRETYLAKIRPFYDVDLVKVITGVRRAGKSVLLRSIRQELLESGVSEDHLVTINLEDLENDYIRSAQDLYRAVRERVQAGERYYVFLDEIQHVTDFERAIASLKATQDVSLFVTGSCSTLLAGELATLLTGRCVEFEVLPFSFSEALAYRVLNGQSVDDAFFFDYLKWGGFPQRFELLDEVAVQRYIESLFQGIANRDIFDRARRIDRKAFHDIALYVLANAGKEFSAQSIAAYYNAHAQKTISQRTVLNYIDLMKKACLLHGVQRYHLTGKQALVNREKYYATDTALRIIQTNTVEFEETFFLENIVYNELLTQGFTVYTGKTYKSEVDFVAIREGKKCFIQVAYLLAHPQTIEREFGAFAPITDASPKYVLSLDKVDFGRHGIAHVNLIDFLTHKVALSLT